MEGERASQSKLEKQGSKAGSLPAAGEGDRPSAQGQNGEGKVVYVNNSSTGGIAEKAASLFKAYDTGNKNALDHDAMMSALAELGVINGLTSKKLTEILSIGSDKTIGSDRSYTLQEFVSFYERLSHYQAKAAKQERIKAISKMSEVPEGENDEQLKRVFLNYCRYTVGNAGGKFDEADPKMSSTQYVKLCQDLGLVQPNGPLNVVTVDVIFHKCKPQGGRRLMFPQYMKALAAAAEESKMDVFELAAMVAQQITPELKTFFAPEPVIFRQEVRNTGQTKVVLANPEPAPAPEEPSEEDEDTPAPQRKPREKKALPESSDDEVTPRKKIETRERLKIPEMKMPETKEDKKKKKKKEPVEEMAPVEGGAADPTLYSMGQGGMEWLANLPEDAPQWMKDMAGKVAEMQQEVNRSSKENYELRQQVKKALGKSRLGNGSGVNYEAFQELARAVGVDPETAIASAQQALAGASGGTGTGAVSGADMANLLVDVDKRLKAVEGLGGGRRGIKGVNRGQNGEGGEEGEGDAFDDLVKKVEDMGKQLAEMGDGEKLRTELKEEMKKVAKSAAKDAAKAIPPLEERVAACEAKEATLEQGAQAQAQQVQAQADEIASVKKKVKQLSENLEKEVGNAISVEMTKTLGTELGKIMGPGGELGNVVAAKVAEAAVENGNKLTELENTTSTGSAKLVVLEGLVAEQAAKVEQALAMAQEGMNRQVAIAPQMATLEASGAEWTRLASSLEAAVRELQSQVKDLQSKNSNLEVRNTNLEAEVEKLKSAPPPAAAAPAPVAPGPLISEDVSKTEARGPTRVPVADMISVAELSGRVMGLESSVKDAQAALSTALNAVGISAAEASKDGAAARAASKRAEHEAALAEINTRLSSIESKQQEARVTLAKAEAMLSGPAAGLAAMTAASAAAANANANDRQKTSVNNEVVVELNARLSSLESRHKEVAASLGSAMSANSAVQALEQTINSKLPHLESQLQTMDLTQKSFMNKLGEFDAFLNTTRTTIPTMDSALKVSEARIIELERKGINNDRLMRDLSDHVKSLQAEQESLATNTAMAAMKAQQGGGGGGGGSDSNALQLVMGSEERLQKHIQQLKEALNNQIAELDAAKLKYDTNLDVMKMTFEQVLARMNNMDAGSGGGGGVGIGYVKASELREMEDHVLERIRSQMETSDKMQRAINQLVADVERLASSHNSSEQARINNGMNARGGPGGVDAGSLQLLEQRVEARLTLMGTQYVTHESLRELELRFATTDAVRMAVEKARANDEVVLAAVKEVDKQLHEKLEVSQQVMLRMARQVDVLQNQLATQPADAGPAQIKIIKGGGSTAPMPSVASTIPMPMAAAEPGQDPLSILLAQANAK